MNPGTTGPSTRLTVLTALAAVFPFLASLLIHNGGVPWGGKLYPKDYLTEDLIGQVSLRHLTCARHALRPWARVSLHIGWTMVSIGVVYALFVWCHFGTRNRQKKISTFMAVVVPVVTVGLFLFVACLCAYVHVILKYGTNFSFCRCYIVRSMKENFDINYSQHGRRMKAVSISSHWNQTQINLRCCGLHNYTDWTRIKQGVVPDSCCRIYKPGCGKNFSTKNIYQRGCEEKLTKHIKHQYITQTQTQQIVCLSVSVVFLSSAILITFFSVKTCMGNNHTENGYVLVKDGNNWSEGAVQKRVTFRDDVGDRFVIEIAINRKT